MRWINSSNGRVLAHNKQQTENYNSITKLTPASSGNQKKHKK